MKNCGESAVNWLTSMVITKELVVHLVSLTSWCSGTAIRLADFIEGLHQNRKDVLLVWLLTGLSNALSDVD